MIELVHMAREPDVPVGGLPDTAAAGPVYPYGLSLTLDAEALADLGIDAPPHAGTEFHLEATGVITLSETRDPDADGDVDSICLTLQITHLGFEHEDEPPLRDSDSDHARRMYGPKEG